jgi:hypothetical protein
MEVADGIHRFGTRRHRVGARARRRGPRLLLKGVNEDNDQARASLDQLAELNAGVLLPGHGEPWRNGVAAAVAEARGHGYW